MEGQQMKLYELLEEFIILQLPSQPSLKFRGDIALGNFQVARFSDLYCEVIFLTTGESLRLEKELVLLCSSFYKSREEEIVRAEDVVGSELWELVVICSRIMTQKDIDPTRLKNTGKLRNWIKERFKISLGPVTYFSRDNIIKI
jgi:hypothetical protein